MAIVFGGANSGADEVAYLFVDGGCVRAELDAISKRYLGRAGGAALNWASFAQSYTKIFYYDALPTRNDGEDEAAYAGRNQPILMLHDTLRKLDRFHVYEGDVRRARGRQERAQQKKVDVMIAVDMLLHTFRRNMSSATLIASDLDFAPLLHALVREGMYVTLWYPPKATNAELQAAADSRLEFTATALGASLLTTDGRAFAPGWTTGRLHVRHHPILHEWILEQGDGIVVSGVDGSHYTAEVLGTGRQPVAYASHHDLRVLMLTAEEKFRFQLPDRAFDGVGGRP